ncbi:MAG: nucleotide kinase domain-containing protein [Marinobacter sp.]|uniref:nucleotide kinase domain-containing protein n=1 Tax=Marinobacter sp. TaxID=50741 RepID=UPI0034A0939C
MKSTALRKNVAAPLSIIRKRRPKASVVFDSYWKFATERQTVFNKRVVGEIGPWTNDPILRAHKFTNAYRASDRVSQYLIKNVLYSGSFDAENTIFRTLLFKIFNKIETWELLESGLEKEISLNTFNVPEYSRLLEAAKASKRSIYSAAYIMPSGASSNGVRTGSKHRFHLELLKSLEKNGFFSQISHAKSMKEGYELLLSLPSIGPFLAYQYITDLNYSAHFDYSEQEFVIPGPGARDGIRKCFTDFGDYSEIDIIRMMSEEQEANFDRLNLPFESLWGRPLQLIDCQNLFCEVDKYARVKHPEIIGRTGRSRIKQKFQPTTPSLNLPWYPPKWGINARVSEFQRSIIDRTTQETFSFEQKSLKLFA